MSDAPARIGPYEVEGRLGAGGMGETYLALRRGPGGFEQRVCLKRIRPEVAQDAELVRQFMAEARIMARLRHATIAQVLDFGEDDGQYYLALELIEGMDLRELLLGRPPLDADTLLHVALQLTAALDVAHRADGGAVIHRDVSTSNVLVSREGEIKLTDFGIARSLDGPVHTRSGVIKGKVPYLAPEYARTGRFDIRSDLFSLGVTLYECARGERPYDGATDIDTFERAASGEHVALSDACPTLPAALTACIERLIDPDPDRRPGSAADLLEALEAMPPPGPRARRALAEDVRRLGRPRVVESARRPTPAELAAPVPGQQSIPAPETRTQAGTPAASRTGRIRGPWVALSIALTLAMVALVVALQQREPALTHEVVPEPSPAATPAAPEPADDASPPVEPEPVVVLPEGRSADDDAQHEQPTAPARLEVVVLPFGEVTVNGRPRGTSPVALRLPPGAHRITARNGDRTFQKQVTLEAGERRRVVLK